MKTNDSKSQDQLHPASKARIGKTFLPHDVAPNNWAFWGARSNPLSSKGSSGTSEDYENYQSHDAREDD